MATFEGTATSNTSIIPASQTDYPEYVDLSNLPASFWSTVKDGGGDIRTYSDAALTTELPREVVSCDTTAETGELHVKHNLSAGDTIYIDVDGIRSDYATTATYGAENVWGSDNQGVWHHQEDPSGTAPQIVDSTSNDNDGTSNGSMTSGDLISAQLADALDFDGSNDYINNGSSAGMENVPYTVSFWMKIDGSVNMNSGGGDLKITGKDDKTDSSGWWLGRIGGDPSNNIRWGTHTGNIQLNVSDWSTWHYVALVQSSNSSATAYVDGSSNVSGDNGFNGHATGDPLLVGSNDTAITETFDGVLDEVRYLNSALSANWITTEYNNQNSPSTFRTWEEVGGARNPLFNFGGI